MACFESPGPQLRMRKEPARPCSRGVRSVCEHERRRVDFCVKEPEAGGGVFAVTCLCTIFRMLRCQRPRQSVTFLTANFMSQHIKISKEKKKNWLLTFPLHNFSSLYCDLLGIIFLSAKRKWLFGAWDRIVGISATKGQSGLGTNTPRVEGFPKLPPRAFRLS